MLLAAGVATAEPLAVARPPCVVKADGLAAGKGVFVCRNRASSTRRCVPSSLGSDFVVEELLEGEVALFALCDGSRALPLAPAQDFKRAYDGDEGPNTGGMGAYSPVGQVGSEDAAELAASIHEPVRRSWPVAMRRSSGSCTRG